MRSLRVVLVAAAAAGLLATFTLSERPARDYRQGDFFQFWAAGRLLLEGADPYDLARWKEFHEQHGSRAIVAPPQPASGPAWTTPYPLWTLIALTPLAIVPFPLAAATWLLTQAALVLVGIGVLSRAVLASARRRDTVLLAGIAIGFQPTWLLVGNGNITGLPFALLCGALALSLSRRAGPAGALLGLLAIKPHPFAVVATSFVIAAGRQRPRLIAGATVAVLALLAASFGVRPGWVEGWLASTGALQGSTGSNATGWTLDRVIPAAALPGLAVLAVVAAFAIWWWRRRPTAAVAIAASVPVSLFAAPHGWSYDHLHLLVTAAVVLELLSRTGDTTRLIGTAALAGVMGPIPWLLYLLAFERGGEELSAIVPLLVLALLIVVERAMPASAAGLGAIAARSRGSEPRPAGGEAR